MTADLHDAIARYTTDALTEWMRDDLSGWAYDGWKGISCMELQELLEFYLEQVLGVDSKQEFQELEPDGHVHQEMNAEILASDEFKIWAHNREVIAKQKQEADTWST